jgi:HK97 family phage portal protein
VIVQSVGSLQQVSRLERADLGPSHGRRGTSIADYPHDPRSYAAFYGSQPNVRTVIDFIARNIAQLGIHVFRRISDTDRERLADHQLADWLSHPTPYVTRYRLIEAVMIDLGIYNDAYWLKIRMPERIGLQRLSPEQVNPVGGLLPSHFQWTTERGDVFEIPTSEVVHFSGYNPSSPLNGLSHLETLRRILCEDIAATDHREAFWRNAARVEGVIERPVAAKRWDDSQIESFRAQWREKFTGGAGAGAVPILQDGATFKTIAFSPRQAEYSTARKLTREEVAAEFHVPLPMVGILDHATFSNIREQHKQLYQDCLGPWLEYLSEEIERQLLPECDDTDRVYVEFNIAEKLSGSFEEQATSLRALVGAPVMTRNEGRARLNLPAADDPGADELVRPLNTTDTPGAEGRGVQTPPPAGDPEPAIDEEALNVVPVIERAWQRQAAVVGKVERDQRIAAFDDERWTKELVADLIPVYRAAGCTLPGARKRAERLAYVVNTDTRTLLTVGAAAFSPYREARDYVP